jgi:hypothetical protein
MKIHVLSDRNAKVVAMLGGKPAKVQVRFRPNKDQFLHEIELPVEAQSLAPHEIHRRLKISSLGQPPTFE